MKNLFTFENFNNSILEGKGEGIHPAVRQKLMDYLKENPKATYPEARDFISDKIKGWKLSEDDYTEARESL
jgi:hypothetical protein